MLLPRRMRVSVAALVVVAAAAMAFYGCGDDGGRPSSTATLPLITALLGTYDVSGVGPGPASGRAGGSVGVVGQDRDGALGIRIDIDTLDAIVVQGTPAADGSLVLDGDRILGGDAFQQTAGTATVTVDDRERRISGMLTDTGESSTSLSFVMVRPTAGTPTSLAASYVFSFDSSPSGCGCASAATLALSVTPDGSGTLGPGIDLDRSGARVGAFSVGTCAVSPQRRIRCEASYEPEGSAGGAASRFLVLQGALPSASGSGTGDFLRGSPPSLFNTGHWSATITLS